MKLLLPANLVASLIIFLSLPALLSNLLKMKGENVYLYIFSACVSSLFFYLLYIKNNNYVKQRDMQNQLAVMEIEAERNTLKSQLNLLENLVLRDSLTGIWNKSYCLDRLQEELHRVQRNSGTFSVLMVDLDHFKHINDNLGHLAGDDYLVAMADVLNSITRYSDVACRYGGDEFLVILPDTTLKGALCVAEKLRSCAESIRLNPDYPLSLSVGICSSCEKYTSIDDIINYADIALYEAKKIGRNRVASAPVR